MRCPDKAKKELAGIIIRAHRSIDHRSRHCRRGNRERHDMYWCFLPNQFGGTEPVSDRTQFICKAPPFSFGWIRTIVSYGSSQGRSLTLDSDSERNESNKSMNRERAFMAVTSMMYGMNFIHKKLRNRTIFFTSWKNSTVLT